MPDPFWWDSYSILWDRTRLTFFVPMSYMTTDEKLNSLVRFGLYAGILLYVYNKQFHYLYLPIILAVVTKVIHDRYVIRETLASPTYLAAEQTEQDLKRNPVVVRDGIKCVPPTADNPFMNPLMGDYRDDPTRPSACPITDEDVKQDATSKFYDGLFRDVNDVFGRGDSARQFYTLPSTTIPNAQDEFANYCYGDMMKNSCKNGHMERCIDEDPKRNRRPPQLDPSSHHYV